MKKGEYEYVVEFRITVAAQITRWIQPGAVTVSDNGDGTEDHSVLIDFEKAYGWYSEVRFIAIKTNAKGDITDIDEDARQVLAEDGQITFTATIDIAADGETVKYYTWADGQISVIDNSPSMPKNFVAKSTAKGIKFIWNQSYDDSENPVKYNVYRDDTLIDQIVSNTYFAPTTSTSKYTYKFIPEDTRGNKSNPVSTDPIARMVMYSCNANGSYNGIEPRENMGNDAYMIIDNLNVGGQAHQVFTSDITTHQHYLYFLRVKTSCDITSEDSDLVFEIVYFDNGTDPIKLVYNGIIPEGSSDSASYSRKTVVAVAERTNTNTFKTAAVRVTDASLRDGSHASGANFGILIPENTQEGGIAIKEIRVIRYDDYGLALEPSNG